MTRRLFLPILSVFLLLAAPAGVLAAQAEQPAAESSAQPAPAAEQQPVAAQRQAVPPETAFAMMSAEAEKGNSGAMLALGSYYEQGVGTPRSYVKALEWYGKAAAAGQAEGYYNVGVCHEIGMGSTGDMAKAIKNYEKAAELGLPLAMYKLSSIYISGAGVNKDVAKGLSWLEKAARAGMAMAANDLGAIYLSGLLGQKRDEKKALDMFVWGANLGSLEAVKNIAVMYKDGLGVQADPAAAYTWYLIARRGGYAGEDLGRMLGLLEGSLDMADIAKARKDANTWMENYARRRAGEQ